MGADEEEEATPGSQVRGMWLMLALHRDAALQLGFAWLCHMCGTGGAS
jgi:hypothetical protein